MSKRIVAQLTAVGILAIALPGCTSFLGLKQAHRNASDVKVRVASTQELSERQISLTEDGRRALKTGMVASAMVSFRQALAEGEAIAPAANGMGVAFVKLGRLDLARQYFEQAVAADPSDSRYSDNLARLEREELLLAAAAAMKVQSNPSPEVPKQGRQESGTMQRLSRGEVMIRTVPSNPAANESPTLAASAAGTSSGTVERVSRGEVRIVTAAPKKAPGSFADLERDFKPIIRITFADTK